MLKKIYHWMGSKVYSKHATLLLGVLFFIEAICFFPTDPMLIFYCIERRKKSFWYATVATFASVLGGITGYFIGLWLWHSAGMEIVHNYFVQLIIKPKTFYYLCEQYKLYQYWALIIAGFTPVPYKAATLTAGFCQLSLFPFIVCSIIARGARFYLVAGILYIWGDQMKGYIDRYINIMAIVIVAAITVILWLFYFL